MGMIMKDGIPYGGIYPIDDAPTQGSNNAVKSGGVHSALSNKVDKVAGKGLSTNDYDDTEKETNEANAEAIEVIENITGAKNLVDIPDKTMTSSGYIVNLVPVYLSAGSYILTFNFNGTSDSSQFILRDANGADLVSAVFGVKNGTNEVSFTLARNGVSMTYYTNAVGDYSKFMIRPAGTDPTYTRPAMSNAELTDKVNRRNYVAITADGVKTYSALLNEIYSLIDISKITIDSKMFFDGAVYTLNGITGSEIVYTNVQYVSTMALHTTLLRLRNNDSHIYGTHTDTSGTTITDVDSLAMAAGNSMYLYY